MSLIIKIYSSFNSVLFQDHIYWRIYDYTSLVERKSAFLACEYQRRRSACESAQSDHSICSLERTTLLRTLAAGKYCNTIDSLCS